MTSYIIKDTIRDFKAKYGHLDGKSPQYQSTFQSLFKWELAMDNAIALAKPPHVDHYMNYVKKVNSDFESSLNTWFPSCCETLDKEDKILKEWYSHPNIPDFMSMTKQELIEVCKKIPPHPRLDASIQGVINCIEKCDKLLQYIKLVKDYYCISNGVFNPTKELAERIQRRNSNSMFVDSDMNTDWDFYEKVSAWLRPCELCDDPQLFFEGVDIQDVRQGVLGNCYFLAAVSNLAYRNPRIIKDMFKEYDTKQGKVIVRFWKDGKEVLVTIDDRLPFGGWGKVLGARSATVNEFWISLLEKAFAKFMGSYKLIGHGGQSDVAFCYLTGAPPASGLTVTPNSNQLDVWRFLMDVYKRGDVIFVYSPQNYKEIEKVSGIKEYHAYAILDLVKVEDEDKIHRLVKLMNPWGFMGSEFTKEQIKQNFSSLEWNGRYSDHSTEWTPRLIKRLSVEFKDDGVFWMCIEDFIHHWRDVKVNKFSQVYDSFY
ncbi:hypothetical protein C9374_001056 [Naegleria lovaniensis]|uniref:Calpain catalytic domain-containing protein n=1 Tax=Naegleria lovaniensis TaxID=51637 RepID=A0AA88GY96_NAELO|nr:uncharacterized protein C9374_001056 [Naegleria lovaniensis]KAG2388206.1 hypothetical protein C9374_001056 [Naegleria lovaniensis]